METTKHRVTIKGTKDGLHFYLDDDCSFDEVVDELRDKIVGAPNQQLLRGPTVDVTVYVGYRHLHPEQIDRLRNVIHLQDNFRLKGIHSEVVTREEAERMARRQALRVVTRSVRSGQVLVHDGDLLLLGDVNPGGSVVCTGNIFILGRLYGMAHAGSAGNRQAIITAAVFQPTQLRIADCISRAPDGWTEAGEGMEFAYLDEENRILVDNIRRLHDVRPHFQPWWSDTVER